ncbi:MAG: RsmB/NOP family class I SAM-dependent RNA methyltransferase [Burkholderiaceae bacterium]
MARSQPDRRPGKPAADRQRSRGGARSRRDARAPALALDQILVELLRLLLRFDQPADRAMHGFFRVHTSAGRRDRQRLADHAYAVLRERRLFAHLAATGPGPLERRLALLAEASGAVPAWLKPNEAEQAWLARLAHVERASLPWAVRASLPDWLAERLQRQCPEASVRQALGDVMLTPAGLDLRVNLIKAQPAQVREALQAAGIRTMDTLAPGLAGLDTLIRVAGRPNLSALPAFEQGWFEVQDAGSQWIVRACAPRRGQTVVDLCAGAGGKTLALAAQMRSSGQIYACDISARRLQAMRPRLARSGATNIQPMRIDDEHDARLKRLRGRADLVLVDAPCAGTGTLRRNPDLKWRYNEADLQRLAAQQRSILAAAAELVAPGGRLVYATCSLLFEENEAVALDAEQAWRQAGAGFERLDIGIGTDHTGAPASGGQRLAPAQTTQEPLVAADPPPVAQAAGPDGAAGADREGRQAGGGSDAGASFLRLWPHLHDCDGFFAAAWRRKPVAA